MKPRDVAGPRAVRDALEALASPRAPPPFVMPWKVKIEEAATTRVLVLDFTGERAEDTERNRIEIGPDAQLPRWFVPLDLCGCGLKPGLCGACTERNTG